MGWQPVLKSVPRSVPRRSFLEEGLAEIAAAVEDIAAYYAPLYTGGAVERLASILAVFLRLCT